MRRGGGVALGVLVAVQLVAIVVLGALTVARFHVFAEIDEQAHYSYVQYVAEDGRLPLLSDPVGRDVEAIAGGTYPRAPAAQLIGIGTRSYEAFQPPLYYFLAAPAFSVAGDHRDKVFAVRAFDLGLLLAAIGVLFLLSGRAFGERRLLPFSVALTLFLWPGVLVRMVTISNASLELLLALLFVHVLWRADAERDPRALVAAGGVLGLGLLTKLTLLYLAPLLAAVALRHLWRRRGRRAAATAALAVLVPAVLIAPWAALNVDHYGSLTANAAARAQQRPYPLPGNHGFGVGDAVNRMPKLLEAFLPQEWDRGATAPGVDSPADLMPLVFLLPALALVAVQPRWLRSREFGVLMLPLVLAVGEIVVTLVSADWDIFFARYLYPTLPGLALFSAIAWRRFLPSERTVLAVIAAISLGCGLSWIYLSGKYYFTEVGSKLGIH